MDPEKYYRDTDLAARYGVRRPTIWEWVRAGRFPEPVRFSPQCTRWLGRDVIEHEARLRGETEAA